MEVDEIIVTSNANEDEPRRGESPQTDQIVVNPSEPTLEESNLLEINNLSNKPTAISEKVSTDHASSEAENFEKTTSPLLDQPGVTVENLNDDKEFEFPITPAERLLEYKVESEAEAAFYEESRQFFKNEKESKHLRPESPEKEDAVKDSESKKDETCPDADGTTTKSNPMGLLTKVTFQNLPPTISPEEFLEVLNPDIEEIEYFNFTYADKHFGFDATATAQISFVDPDIAESYLQRFNEYIIVDITGDEFPISTEYAMNQNVPKPCTKVDTLMGTLEESEEYKAFCESFKESVDGIFGVKPQYSDMKEMSDEVLKQIEEKEENKGKLKSTPLLDALRDRLLQEKARLVKEREDLAARRKEREKSRFLRKEARRERREQERRERREKEKRERIEREKREREKRDKRNRDNRERPTRIESRNKEKEPPVEKSATAVTVSKKDEPAKKSEETSKRKENVEVKPNETGKNNAKNEKADTRPSTSKHQSSKESKYNKPDNTRSSYNNDRDKDYKDNSRRSSYNERRSYGEKYPAYGREKVERDRPPRKYDDRPSSNNTKKNNSDSASSKSKETPDKSDSKVLETPASSKQSMNTASEVPKSSKAENKDNEQKGRDETSSSAGGNNPDSEKPKKKIVKKVVKVIRVKGTDVSADGKLKINEQRIVRKDDVSTSKKESHESKNSSATKNEPSSSTTAGSSKQESMSGSADRPRKGRPDMQIYRPGSLRQNLSSGGGSNNGNSRGKNDQRSYNASNSKANSSSTSKIAKDEKKSSEVSVSEKKKDAEGVSKEE